jgi:hypothetical protein
MAPSHRKSTKKAEVGTERLDVEEDEARQKRLRTSFLACTCHDPNLAIESLLEHLSAPSTHPGTTMPAFPAPPMGLPKFNFGDRRTEAVVPNTERASLFSFVRLLAL